jgi:hypothetical protein
MGPVQGLTCVIIGFSPHEEILPTEDEIEQAETELYFEHYTNTVTGNISSKAEHRFP